MQDAIDQVMRAYTLMANLTPEEAQATTRKTAADRIWPEWYADEKTLAVEGLRYLRGRRPDACGEEWRGKQHDGQSDQEGSA